jgi:isopenicillin N synthase-like dioxygenase
MPIQVVDYFDSHSSFRFTQSLKETGFGIIENHPLDQALIDYVYSEWFKFFKLAEEEKTKYAFNPKTYEGFVSCNLSETAKGCDRKDLKEFYHYYPWGSCPENLRKLTNDLYEQMAMLGATLLQWVEDNTPADISARFSIPLRQMIKDSPRTLFRLIHYPPLTGKEDPNAIRAAAHEDINLMTILPAATAEGLQVLDTKGQWHNVPCDARCIIVNSGDMLEECTQGYYKSTTHRVMNPIGEKAKQSRLSMPLFLHPADEIHLSERHTAGTYRKERIRENGLAETGTEVVS